jgi:hypothetical protein
MTVQRSANTLRDFEEDMRILSHLDDLFFIFLGDVRESKSSCVDTAILVDLTLDSNYSDIAHLDCASKLLS